MKDDLMARALVAIEAVESDKSRGMKELAERLDALADTCTLAADGMRSYDEKAPTQEDRETASNESAEQWAANHGGESPHQEGCEIEHDIDEPCDV